MWERSAESLSTCVGGACASMHNSPCEVFVITTIAHYHFRLFIRYICGGKLYIDWIFKFFVDHWSQMWAWGDHLPTHIVPLHGKLMEYMYMEISFVFEEIVGRAYSNQCKIIRQTRKGVDETVWICMMWAFYFQLRFLLYLNWLRCVWELKLGDGNSVLGFPGWSDDFMVFRLTAAVNIDHFLREGLFARRSGGRGGGIAFIYYLRNGNIKICDGTFLWGGRGR